MYKASCGSIEVPYGLALVSDARRIGVYVLVKSYPEVLERIYGADGWLSWLSRRSGLDYTELKDTLDSLALDGWIEGGLDE